MSTKSTPPTLVSPLGTPPKQPSANTGGVEILEGEPFRFLVASDKNQEKYVVDVQNAGWLGACNCMHFSVRCAPKIAGGERGPELRCKHIRRAREFFLEAVLPKLAKAMGMEEPDILPRKPSTEYLRLRQEFLAKHPKCVVFPALNSCDVHHAFGRRGPLLTEVKLWIPVSRLGHCWVDANRNEARQRSWNGIPLLAPLGEWNNPNKNRLK